MQERIIHSLIKKISLIFMIVSCSHLLSQTNKIDSLSDVLKREKRDTVRMRLLNSLSWRLRNKGETDKAIDYAKQAVLLAEEKLKDKNTSAALAKKLKRQGAHAWANIGNAFFEAGAFEKALANYIKAREIFIEINDSVYMAHSLDYIGETYKNLANYPLALRYYNEAESLWKILGKEIELRDSYSLKAIVFTARGEYAKAIETHLMVLSSCESKNDKFGCARSYNNLGNVYKDKEENETAAQYYNKALKLWEELKYKKGIVASLNNLGLVHQNKGDFEKALDCFLKVLGMLEEKNKKSTLLAGTFGNLSNVYGHQENYSRALYYALKGMKMFEDLEDRLSLSISYNNVANIYLNQKNYKLSLEYCNKSSQLAKAIGSLNDEMMAEKTFDEIYSVGKKYDLALSHYKAFVAYRDSLFNEENTKKETQAQMNYEFDKKETASKAAQDKKDLLVREEKQQQQIAIASISTGLVLVIMLALVILRSLRQNQKKNKIITEQKLLVEHQKELVEEKQKEILDSIYYARRIQRALITNERYITTELNRVTPNKY